MIKQLEFTLPDGSVHHYKAGTDLEKIAADFQPQFNSPIVAAILNNQFRDLLYVPQEGGCLRLIDLSDQDGVRVYSRSLFLVLFRAADEVLPGCKVRIEHSLSKGIYGEIDCANGKPLTEKEVRLIAERMQEIISANEPITKETIPLDQASSFFEKAQRYDKVRLLKFREKPDLHVYHCGNYTDYLYGYMTPSTGYLKQFELKYYLPGFILRFPTVQSPSAIPRFEEQRKLFGIYHEFEKWGRILEVEDVGALNQLVVDGKGGDLIRIAEALHEKKIAQIADQITANRDQIRLILVAGPSSSGKTTFAQRLAVQLRVNGLRPVSISIDDYFVNRDQTPIGPDGLPDFESLEAIDLKLFNEQITSLIQGLPVKLPRYDFRKGQREYRDEVLQIADEQPIIIEGIHGLNDRLTSEIPKDHKFKIYISALTQLNIDDHNRIPTTDNRIIRRIVRDHQFRGHNAVTTISLWPRVRRGEEQHIFPFQEEADVMFNSALIYELAVLKLYAEPLLASITPDYPEHTEAKRILKFLSYFKPLADCEVPLNSILREFLGCSCFR